MRREDWARVREIFEELLGEPAEEREASLAHRCGGDEILRSEVSRLLDLHQRADDFLEEPAVRLLAEPVPGPTPGYEIGSYRLVREIARGGMGLVFEARRADEIYDKRVAVKFLRPEIVSPELRESFGHERRILARVEHPAVARIIDGGSTPEGWPFMMMEYVEGDPVTVCCEDRGLDLEQRVRVFADVCRGIHAVHRSGVVHGDIKPSNVLMGESGDPRVVDFGIGVSVPRSGEPALRGLTPGYASPEQRAGDPLTTATDVYSLGRLLFELATGTRPASGTEPAEGSVRRAILDGEVPGARRRRGMAKGLASVISRATREEPGARYPSVTDLTEDVERVVAGLPPRALDGHPVARVWNFALRRRHQLVPVALVLVVAAVTATVVVERSRERVETTRRYVGEAREIEYESEIERMLPRHDLRPYRKRLVDRVARLEGELASIAGWSAPVEYAVGVGKLQLGDHDGARTHLERAWGGGLRTPDVGRALVVALDSLYRDELEEIERLQDPDARTRRLHDASARYHEPAVEILGELAGSSSGKKDAAYLLALTDYLAGRPREAWNRLEALDPRRIEPRTSRLEGDVLSLLANGLRRKDPDQALRLFDRAETAYARAKSVWRSDPALHASDCSRAVAEVTARWESGQSEASIREALESCEAALEIDPGSTDVLADESRLFALAAQEDLIHGRDPTPRTRAALERSVATLRGGPSDVALHRAAAAALSVQAKWELGQGGDPLPTLEDSRLRLRAALDIDSTCPINWNNLGNTWGIEVRYHKREGSGVAEPLRRAISAYETALGLEELPAIHVNLGVAYQMHAELNPGSDSEVAAWVRRSRSHYERALEMAPDRAIYRERAAGIDLFEARLALDDGRDPLPSLDRAIARLRGAIAADPACLDCTLTLAEALVVVGGLETTAAGLRAESFLQAEELLASVPATARGSELLAELERRR